MGATSLALLFLALGFVFVSRWTVTRAIAQRAAENPQYFHAALAGAVVFLLAHHLVDSIEHVLPLGASLVAHLDESGASAVTGDVSADTIARAVQLFLAGIVIALFLPACLNARLQRNASLKFAIVERSGARTDLERLVGEAMMRNFPLMLTQGTGKVFVGFIVGDEARSLNLGAWIRMQPLLSGFRDDRQRFDWDTSYEWLHAEDDVVLRWLHRTRRDFDIVLPVDSITSAHAFDVTLYEAVYAHSDGSDATTVARHALAAGPVVDDDRSVSGRTIVAAWSYWSYCAAVMAVLPLASFADAWAAAGAIVIAAALAWLLRFHGAAMATLRTN